MTLLVASGCAPLIVTKSWKAEITGSGKYTRILVVKMIRDSSGSIPKNMVDQMTGALRRLGYNAVSSLQEYSASSFDLMEESIMLNQLRKSGIDAIITITLLNVERERAYIPDVIYYPPNGDLNRVWGYQAAHYNRIYGPQFQIVETKYTWESNLYDLTTQKLVYSIQIQSSPENSEKMSRNFVQLIVRDMVEKKVLKDSSGHLLKIVSR